MAHKRSKKRGIQHRRRERRFVPSKTTTSGFGFWGGMAGSLLLGAGVYAAWIRDPAIPYAALMVGAGAALFVLALVLGDVGTAPVRIGDAGVALERGTEFTRIPWCDLKRVYVAKGRLIAQAEDGTTLSLPLRAHSLAAAWLLSETVRRVPEVMDVKPSVVDALPKPDPGDGESVVVQALQVVGRHCAASGEPIQFERDARLCPRCAQVYGRNHVPRKCRTCGADLGEAAVAL
ncbi:MAG: hypothetical protein JW940_34000 [Polyangiaceae bacterium]|nr:hypothetical protein [Polyangiaceae bacterium]